MKISEIACANINLLFDSLDIEMSQGHNNYYSHCHIHGGDKFSALNIYPEGHTNPGYWRCITRKCEKIFVPTVIGFARGVLSRKEYSWSKQGDKTISFQDAIDYVVKAYGIDVKNIEGIHKDFEKNKFMAQTAWSVPMHINQALLRKEDVRKKLIYPAQYFIRRGFSSAILDRYDIGYCNDPAKPMYKRCVVPIYDEDYKFVVGCTGRSIYEECQQCKCHHGFGECKFYPKWKNNKNFNRKDFLYNYWFAKDVIKKTKTAILVESPGNVWRLEEAGIHHSLALFGGDLSDTHQFLLEKLGVLNIVVIMDNDTAGKDHAKKIYNQISKFYNIRIIEIEKNDIADMSVSEIKKLNIGE